METIKYINKLNKKIDKNLFKENIAFRVKNIEILTYIIARSNFKIRHIPTDLSNKKYCIRFDRKEKLWNYSDKDYYFSIGYKIIKFKKHNINDLTLKNQR